jgi:hypothetical protein
MVLINVEPQDEGDEDCSTSVFMSCGTKFAPHDVIFDSGAEAHVFRDDLGTPMRSALNFHLRP